MDLNKPKILYFDIETSPAIASIFRIGKQHVAHDQVLKRPEIMCICWAWGDGKVQSKTFDLKKYDWKSKDDNADYELLKEFSDVFQQADLVIGHNAKKFDIAVLVNRIIRYQLSPLKPVLIDDTWTMTKDIAFMSHKLDDLGEYLGVGRKKPHGNGYEWWIDVIRGDKKRLADMAKYCQVDVERLRSVYKKIQPYTRSSLNMAVFSGDPSVCRSCGSNKIQKRGFTFSTVGKRQKYQCTNCGAWMTQGTNLIKKSGSYVR